MYAVGENRQQGIRFPAVVSVVFALLVGLLTVIPWSALAEPASLTVDPTPAGLAMESAYKADLNEDNVVDEEDLLIFLRTWHTGVATVEGATKPTAGENPDPLREKSLEESPTPTNTPASTATPTLTSSSTPTPTFRVWQFYRHSPDAPGVSKDTWDIDLIDSRIENDTMYDFAVCWGGHLPNNLNFSVERKTTGNWAPINRDIKWQETDKTTSEGFYKFRESSLTVNRYYYRVLLDGTPVADDEGDGIQVVTPHPTGTPTATPPYVNMLKNGKLAFRLIDGVAAHWSKFTWENGYALPPTGSTAGTGAAAEYNRCKTDVPSGGGKWSQEISQSDEPFCGGVFQQVRVHPGFEYEVSARARIVEGADTATVGLGVALDGSMVPYSAELCEWDEKASATDLGNWGIKESIGTDWIDREYLRCVVRPVADTMTVFLFGQSVNTDATTLRFNDVVVRQLTTGTPTPTPDPRCFDPLLTIRDGEEVLMVVGASGHWTASSINEESEFPQNIAEMPWRVYEGTEGAWLDSEGDLYLTGSVINYLPPMEDRVLSIRGAAGRIVFAITDSGDVACAGYFAPDYDSDSDFLSNLDEIALFGTKPNKNDTDDDGVSDYVELFGGAEPTGTPPPGYTPDPDHTPAPNLRIHEWGANPLHKDLWLEIDWIATPTPGGEYENIPPMDPPVAELENLAEAFSRGQVVNPDGIPGITLHIDGGPEHSVNFEPLNSGDFGGGSTIPFRDDITNTWQVDAWLSGTYFRHKHDRVHLFRYTVICYGGGWGSVTGGTYSHIGYVSEDLDCCIAHELGHSLGLSHGGSSGDAPYWFKPNYPSTMCYTYRSSGDEDYDGLADGDSVVRFSVGDRLDLDESALYEDEGVAGPDYVSIDWNGDGYIDRSAYEYKIEGLNDKDPSCLVLHDFNDFENILYVRKVGYGPGVYKSEPPEGDDIDCSEFFQGLPPGGN